MRLSTNRSQMILNVTQACYFCSWHILTSSLIYYRKDPRKHGIYSFFYDEKSQMVLMVTSSMFQ